MLESIFSYSTASTLTISNAVISILISFVAGIIVSLTYIKTYDNQNHSPNFALTIVLLPAIISTIIMLIGSDIARAFSLAGAFSIIRFRSAPGDPKDIAFVLFAMAAGLSAGVGLTGFALIFTVILCFVMFILNYFKFGQLRKPVKKLKITIPEDLDYESVFLEVFNRYTISFNLVNVKTAAMGSLYQLTYEVILNDPKEVKSFIDDIRYRNGNLNISLNLIENESYS